MKQKHTLIIGGTKGLGKLLAKMLSEENQQVTILGRSKPAQEFEKTVDYVQVDLLAENTLIPALDHVIQTKGKINNLIFLQRFKGEGDRWYGEIEVGLNATCKVIEHLKNSFATESQQPASIVMVSSVAGKLANNSQPISYSLVKAGFNNMVKYYSYELGRLGIRVNGVSPITFVKEESKKFYYEENVKIKEFYQKIIPLARMCTAEDVANAIVFLCSPEASFISGQNLDIDGGLSAVSHETLARALIQV